MVHKLFNASNPAQLLKAAVIGVMFAYDPFDQPGPFMSKFQSVFQQMTVAGADSSDTIATNVTANPGTCARSVPCPSAPLYAYVSPPASRWRLTNLPPPRPHRSLQPHDGRLRPAGRGHRPILPLQRQPHHPGLQRGHLLARTRPSLPSCALFLPPERFRDTAAHSCAPPHNPWPLAHEQAPDEHPALPVPRPAPLVHQGPLQISPALPPRPLISRPLDKGRL